MIYAYGQALDAHGGYVLVTPHSSVEDRANGKHRWHWMDGDERSDYVFTQALLDYLVAHRGVDRRLLFATGHSSGGIYLYSWASGGPSRAPAHATEAAAFRAISPSGANMMVGSVDVAGKSVGVPLLH